MQPATTVANELRQRLLEGVLLRVALLPPEWPLTLRGGMLLQHLLQPLLRVAQDVDLVAVGPLTMADAMSRYEPLFAINGGDGVTFTVRHREAIWTHTPNPGVRFIVSGIYADNEREIQVDITGGPWPRPEPVRGELPTLFGPKVRVLVARAESLLGDKLQGLWRLGERNWRPKDLCDLRLLLLHVPYDRAALRVALVAYMADVEATMTEAQTLFAAPWWTTKRAGGRWWDFARAHRGLQIPTDLTTVVAEVATLLAPLWERQP